MNNIYQFEIWKRLPLARGEDFWKKSIFPKVHHLIIGLILFCVGMLPLDSLGQSILIESEICNSIVPADDEIEATILAIPDFSGTIMKDEVSPASIIGKDIIFILTPSYTYNAATKTALDGFVQNGGSLIVAGCPCCPGTTANVNDLLNSLVPASVTVDNIPSPGIAPWNVNGCRSGNVVPNSAEPIFMGITSLSGECAASVSGGTPLLTDGLGNVLFTKQNSGLGEIIVTGDLNYFAPCGENNSELLKRLITSLNQPPVAICKPPATMPSFQLDGTCSFTLTSEDIDAGSSDTKTAIAGLMRTIATTSILIGTGASAITFNSPGMYDVYLKVEDEDGLVDECMTTITIVDNMPPAITCKDYTVSLVNGAATIVPIDVYSAANDNCGGTSVSLDKYEFSCLDVGDNIVKVIVTDDAGQSAMCNATVTVVNNSAPEIKCNEEPIVVVLDENGAGVITEEQALISIGQVCGDTEIVIERTSFTCEDAGEDLTLKVTVTDLTNSSVSECNILVKVQDEEKPVIECKDALTVYLSHVDEDGQIKLDPRNLLKSYSDNCSIDWEKSTATFTIGTETFDYVDCSNAETTVNVEVVVVDYSGNSAACFVDIFVDDNVSPELACFDAYPHRTFYLGEEGILNLTLEQLHGGDPSSLYEISDNCATGPFSVFIEPIHFTCPPAGERTVTITAYDGNGNKATCDITINVEDNLPPEVTCLNGIERTLDNTTTEVAVTIDDLIFTDPANPDNDLANYIKDNCEVKEIKIARDTTTSDKLVFVDVVTFDCEDIGDNNVIIRVLDNSDNMTTCETNVVIGDDAAPVAYCLPDFDLPLVMGTATITTEDIIRDIEDNCGIESVKINDADELTFDCSHITFDADGLPEPILITLKVTDVDGNEAECETYVTIIDNTAPTIVCPTGVMSVDLDEYGNGEITKEAVKDFILANGGSYEDDCGVDLLEYEVDQEAYTCGDVGAHVIKFTVIDKGGNKASCDIDIWVQDNRAPVVTCKPNGNFNPLPFTLSNGSLKLTTADILASATDNCGVSGLSISPSNFDCSHIGIPQFVTVTAFDIQGNTGTCTAIILIESSATPRAKCRDVELILDETTGTRELTVNMVNNGSEGDCETTLSFDPDNLVETLNFDCSHVTFDEDGVLETQEVTLYVTDKAGNQESCTATITVRDMTAPVANCRLTPLELPLTDGVALVPIGNINTTSFDGCGKPVKLSVFPETFDCSHVGTPQIVTLTVEDESGNKSTCTTTVNVVNNQAPVLECKTGIVELAIGADGMKTLAVEDLVVDNFVPCATGITYEIEVEGRDEAKFTCEDINFEGAPIIFNVKLTATANGQSVECHTEVVIIDDLAPTLICSDEVVIVELDAWGKIEITADNVPFDATDNCGIRDTIISPEILFCEHIADLNEITITVIDSAGNEAVCTRQVKVEDNILPTIVCPEPVTLEPTAECIATHTWTIPVPTDNCKLGDIELFVDANVDITISEDGLTATADFPTGETIITYRAVDKNNNDQICVYRVTVEDTRAPDFGNCPTGTVLLQTDPGACTGSLSLSDDLKITVSDNCDMVSYICKFTYPGDLGEEELDILNSINGHSEFPKGRTLVRLTARDAYGNEAVCEFDVFVSDDEFPTITFNDRYPALQGLTNEDTIEIPLADINLIGVGNVTVGDNCPGVQLISFEDIEITGDQCADGSGQKTFECTWIAEDAKGNRTALTIIVKLECAAPRSDLSLTKNSIGLTFNTGDTRTLVLNLEETLNETTGQVEIIIPKTPEFDFAFDPTVNSIPNPLYEFGIGDPTSPIHNDDWEFIEPTTFSPFYSLVSKPGVTFEQGVKNSIVLQITALIEGGTTNYQAEIFTGGGENTGNDLTNIFFAIQRND